MTVGAGDRWPPIRRRVIPSSRPDAGGIRWTGRRVGGPGARAAPTRSGTAAVGASTSWMRGAVAPKAGRSPVGLHRTSSAKVAGAATDTDHERSGGGAGDGVLSFRQIRRVRGAPIDPPRGMDAAIDAGARRAEADDERLAARLEPDAVVVAFDEETLLEAIDDASINEYGGPLQEASA